MRRPIMLKGDLPDNTSGEFLYCAKCGSRYSADRFDYFWMADTAQLRCGHDNNPLLLVREHCQLEVIR